MLDVADCCETMEEARGVIRRLERAWPKKLTDEQIRECWRECGHNAPIPRSTRFYDCERADG